jgi:hypothetical protein
VAVAGFSDTTENRSLLLQLKYSLVSILNEKSDSHEAHSVYMEKSRQQSASN